MSFGNRFTRWIYNRSPAAFQNLMASVYARGRSRVKYGPKFYEYLTDLERTQYYDNDALDALQTEKLRRMLFYAGRYIPYYHKLFLQMGIHPENIHTVRDLAQLPVLEKSTVQARLNDFRSSLYTRHNKDIQHFETSGTTGKALDIYITPEMLQMDRAYAWLHRSWAGVRIGDRVAAFVGFPIISIKRKNPPFWIYDSVEDRMIFSLQHMSKANLSAYAEQLSRFKPVFIMGYPAALYLISLYLCDEGYTNIKPKAVFTSSETLLSHQREIIERAFGCKVLDHYGSTEYTVCIIQCEVGNYHIQAEYGVVEILREDGNPAAPGEPGEIVGTCLNNYAMPLIRYRLGDRAVPKMGTCSCGRGGHLVERIVGRIEDTLVMPDGRYLSRLDFVFKGIPNVAEAQLVQEVPDHLQVLVVRRPAYTDQDTKQILTNLRERMGNDIKIDLTPVEQIPRTPSGKFRYVISKVPLALGQAAQTGDIMELRVEEDDRSK